MQSAVHIDVVPDHVRLVPDYVRLVPDYVRLVPDYVHGYQSDVGSLPGGWACREDARAAKTWPFVRRFSIAVLRGARCPPRGPLGGLP